MHRCSRLRHGLGAAPPPARPGKPAYPLRCLVPEAGPLSLRRAALSPARSASRRTPPRALGSTRSRPPRGWRPKGVATGLAAKKGRRMTRVRTRRDYLTSMRPTAASRGTPSRGLRARARAPRGSGATRACRPRSRRACASRRRPPSWRRSCPPRARLSVGGFLLCADPLRARKCLPLRCCRGGG